MGAEVQTKTEKVQTEIAAAWSKDKVVSGPIIKRYQMRATTKAEEAKGKVHVEPHERVVLDLGKDEKGRSTTFDAAAKYVLIKPRF